MGSVQEWKDLRMGFISSTWESPNQSSADGSGTSGYGSSSNSGTGAGFFGKGTLPVCGPWLAERLGEVLLDAILAVRKVPKSFEVQMAVK